MKDNVLKEIYSDVKKIRIMAGESVTGQDKLDVVIALEKLMKQILHTISIQEEW